AGLEALIFDLLTDPPVPVPRQMLEDLALALATYGTVQRNVGRRLDAFYAFQAAFQAAERAQRPSGLAHTYRKAAFLICEHGQPSVAARYLEHARELFLRAGDTLGCYETFNNRAWVWVHCGEIEKAAEDYQTAAACLPADQRIQLFAAYAGLAYCHQELGDLAAALDSNEKAEALQGGEANGSLAFLVWNRAKLAAELGETAVARREFQRATALLIEYSDPIDGAICALDLATLLVSRGEAAAVRELAEQMLSWLPAFRGHRVADAVMAELIRCAKWGEITLHFLDGAREKLEKTRL
ncbi:MAG: hypothetical protein AAGF23_26440, partial [Acidobacteriota bacterium]